MLQYASYVLLAITTWMLLIDGILVGPLRRKFLSAKDDFQLAFLQGDYERMVMSLRDMRLLCNKQRIIILCSGHPVMLYRWLRGRWPPIAPGEEERKFISQ